MQIDLHPKENAALVTIAGSVDGTTADALQTTLRGYVTEGHTHLVVDMGDVDYTSSAGLRALLATVKDARQRGGDLRLANIVPNVMKVLDLSGFTSILKTFADVDAALASYQD